MTAATTPSSDALPRCAEGAELRGDPLEATAPHALGWLLVEHPGPWARRAVEDSGLPAGAVGALLDLAGRHGARPTLVRRFGRESGAADRPRRWALVDCRPGHEGTRWGSYSAPDELARLDLAATEVSTDPVYLVCTHGRHDTCCALRGRPVAAALAATRPGQTWECSHVGGDRFAANVVVLPHGFYYGHLTAQAAAQAAGAYEAGRVHPGGLRGRCSLSAPEQAAQHHARLRFDEFGADALPVLDTRGVDGQTWAVTLQRGAGTTVEVTVAARTVPGVDRLTCSATAAGPVRVFDLVDVAQQSR